MTIWKKRKGKRKKR